MEPQAYLNVLAPDDIRVKGTRIGIETILYDYLYRERTAEEIAQTYPSLTLEQVYAVILYYLQNQVSVSQYLIHWLEWGHQQRKAQKLNPHPASARLEKLRQEQESAKTVEAC